MRSSSISLIGLFISILVSSFLSLPCEEDIEMGFLADKVYSDVLKQPKNLHAGEGSGISLVPTQTPILQKGVQTTKLLGVECVRELATFTPESAGQQSWKVYYRVAPKVSSAHGQISEIKDLAQAVTDLGKDFTSKVYTDDGIAGYIVPCLNLAHHALTLDSLGVRERIWALGVLSCLKWSIPAQQSSMRSSVFEHTFPSYGFRGNLEIHLLQDQPLKRIVKKMWEGSLAYENLSQHTAISEVLKRSSLAGSVMTQLQKNTTGFEDFRKILEEFLNLKSPIYFPAASQFIKNIVGRLGEFDYIDPWHFSRFDEPKALIQLLLHMHENYIDSRDTFLQLTKNRQLPKSVLEYDIIICRDYGRQPKALSVRKIYDDMMANRGGNIEDLIPILKILAQDRLLIPLLSEMSLLP
ncbi:hypothetical protein DFH28DRAFT_1119838 [Melampsora americana]|nr:hypothetical protein DFH28DRAFT_1119838 [Melampsora americana]